MNARRARAIARKWVEVEGQRLPGFVGAVLHGSINWLPDEAEIPPTSDVDLLIILEGAVPETKLGKFRYRELLLEVSFLASDEISSAAAVLGSSHLVGSFVGQPPILDPTGRLRKLRSAVIQTYSDRSWVEARCRDVERKLHRFLGTLDPAAPLHDNATAWLFGTSMPTHLMLVAALENPTVRKRYVAAREVLIRHGHAEHYEQLLALLGCATLTPEQVSGHLDALAELFDLAVTVVPPSYPFAADLAPSARPVAIDGSRELIAAGLHREAIFWIGATFGRCLSVLDNDGSAEMFSRFVPSFRAFLADLGINGYADFTRRAAEVEAMLPEIWHVVRQIMDANPAITMK